MKTPLSEVRKRIENGMELQLEFLVGELQVIGEKVVNEVRINGSYKDQTGNLRSSTGYKIAVNGSIVSGGGFAVVKSGNEGMTGGEKFAEELASKEKNGVSLIIVAGMHYARYVQARGYNVLHSGRLLAKELVKELLEDING